MSLIPIAAILFASWSGTFDFGTPVTADNGMPLLDGTVNIQEPGLPMYPVKTIFVPVPEDVVPELQFTSVMSRGFTSEIPRAGMLQGSGLEVVEVPAEPVDRRMETVELTGIFPLAGTQVAVVDIHPLTEQGLASSVTVSLSWDDRSSGMRIPENHLLYGLAQGNVYWPGSSERASSPFWGKPWARVSISETGGYRLTCDELEAGGCPVTGAPVQTLALFSGPGTQFDNAPETEHQLEPVAVVVEDSNGDGFFNEDDAVVFIAGGLNRFEYRNGVLEWLYHRYADDRVYWLTWGGDNGERMDAVSGSPDSSPSWGSSIPHIVHMEESGVWMPEWERRTGWFQEKISSGEQITIPIDVDYTSGLSEVTIVFAVTEPSSYEISLQGYGSVQLSGSGSAQAVFSDVDLSGLSQLQVGFDSENPDADVYLDYVELSFPADASASGRRLFPGGPAGRYTFQIQGGISAAFDTSDLMNPLVITGGTQSSGVYSFSYTLTDTSSIMVLGEDDWLSPETVASSSPGRLVGTIFSGNRLLVVPPEFTNDALALEYLLEEIGYSVVTATTEEIYDEFGQGVKDPGAIRSAVRWGMDSWSTPLSTVILCGDGNYDPMGYSTTSPDLVPAMIFVGGSSSYPAWAVEDWFSQVHENSYFPEIPVARIPAGNAAAFGTVCAKSALYYSGETGGSWSSRAVLFADDEWGKDGAWQEGYHTEHLEEICYGDLPVHATPEKFYLIDFPWPPGTTPQSVHPEKPDARAAFLNLWNSGMGLLVFHGHGSANQLAHEKVLLGDDPAAMENGSRLPLVMFMSCDVSRFFNPGIDCIGEKVVYHPGGGAIASIGATGPTGSGGNLAYSQAILGYIFSEEDRSMGYAFWAGKLEAGRSGNSSYYVFLGVPDLPLMMSQNLVEVTVENDTLYSGEINTVSGSGVSQDGLALIEISESDIPWQYTMIGGGVIDYFRQGGTAWRGREPLSHGSFTAECMIPVSSSEGYLARADAASVVASGIEFGADAPLVLVQGDAPTDFQGPEISMWITGQKESTEPVITGEGQLEAELSDPSGITFLGRTGKTIQLFVDDTEYDLSDSFSYNTGSTETGQLQYTMSGLAAGQHRLILRAQDGVGNPSSDTLYVTSTDAADVAIQQHLVYPNPGTGTRCFSFNVSSSAQVTVSIFTTAGRCIQRLSQYCNQGYNQIIWDGFDGDGDIPASGAYIYMIEAQTENGLFSQSSTVTGVLATVN